MARVAAVAALALFLLPTAGAATLDYTAAVANPVAIAGMPSMVMALKAAHLSDGRTLVAYVHPSGTAYALEAELLGQEGNAMAGPFFLTNTTDPGMDFSLAGGTGGRAEVAWVSGQSAFVAAFDGAAFAAPAILGFGGLRVTSCEIAGGESGYALACDSSDQNVTSNPSRVRLLRLDASGAEMGAPSLVGQPSADGMVVRALAVDRSDDAWVAYQNGTPSPAGEIDLIAAATAPDGTPAAAPTTLISGSKGSLMVSLGRSPTRADAVYAAFAESFLPQLPVEVHLIRLSTAPAVVPPPAIFSDSNATLTSLGVAAQAEPAGDLVFVGWAEERDGPAGANTYRSAFGVANDTLGVLFPATPQPELGPQLAAVVTDGTAFVDFSTGANFHRITISPPAAASPPQPAAVSAPALVWVLAVGLGGVAFVGLASASERFRWLLLVGVWPLYVALRRETVLVDNMRRGAILQVITESPGIRFSDLSRRTGINMGALRHHLTVLETHGFVARSSARQAVRFYPAGKNPIREEPFREIREQILGEVRRTPGLSHTDLAGRIGIKWTTLRYHTAILEEQGLVRTAARGRRLALWPTEKTP